ncbi:MAG: filamentous hemagglutinin N-terminal domain-containing protein [Leptolyngbya sp. UWPOB_LEPTO1]|uniref:two-partner secretion domain-containing protein n=1 Tax=Leptolyngbya sp. UWPOB_LEPTO1 TaxID=2815653 RepID=UPI001AC5F579|nr:filamentous hemagglutinin N-terminal domain-containing protein [Leptolyngbya sp. UWPOB_LEPTO1]MBN8564839.1 filamentous hemagglutinin N-terminal domain-containing protein [Leptolyngbya sp. UWPOB_LEPTO1]
MANLGWLSHRLWQIGVTIAAVGAMIVPARAQIVPDSTLGNERSQVNPFNAFTDVIEGGAERGRNLFHSFQDFNVAAGRNVYIISPNTGIENILARVTGKNPSQIFGRLGTASRQGSRLFAANANLFLINPNGIVFGKDATLDVDRSFVATTANAIQFGDQGSFSASRPEGVADVLNIDPSAFLFNQLPVGNITVNSNAPIRSGSSFLGLHVPDGQNLTLLGGNVTVDGGQLNAFGGRVEIGAIAGTGEVGLNPNGSLRFPANVDRADVLFSNDAKVDVSNLEKGDISITARNILLDSSKLIAGIDSSDGTDKTQAGNITLNATGEVKLIESSRIQNDVNRNRTGNSGNLTITANSLVLTGGSQISASSFGTGNTGNVTVKVSDRVLLSGATPDGEFGSAILSRVEKGGNGRGGNLSITANTLEMTDGASLSASMLGTGDAGDIAITVQDRVSLNKSDIFGNVGETGRGTGGNLSITANTLELTNGASLSASTFGTGHAGNATITVQDQVLLNNSSIFGNVEKTGKGNGGGLFITANTLELINGAKLSASTFGMGDAGDVTITVQDRVSLNNSDIFNNIGRTGRGTGGNLSITANTLELSEGSQLVASTNGKGNAGNVTISASTLELTDGASLSASTSGTGDAGDVTITTQERVALDNSSIFSNVEVTGKGNGGNLSITANTLELTNGAKLSTSTFGTGNTGNVTISVQDRVSLSSSNFFNRVEKTGKGEGGNLFITANTLALMNGSQLIADTEGVGNAGNFTIQVRDRISLSGINPTGSRSLVSNQVGSNGEGRSGNINIFANTLELSDGAQLITGIEGKGNSGDITLNVQDRISLRNGNIFNNVGKKGRGNGGNLLITAHTLELTDGSQLVLSTDGTGNAGNAKIQVRDLVSLSGTTPDDRKLRSTIFTRVGEGAEGKGGNIDIAANRFEMSAGARLNASTLGTGNAGNIIIEVLDRISLRGSNIFNKVEKTGAGNGGNLFVTANTFELMDGSQLVANTEGVGNAGNVRIQVRDRLTLNNSDIFSSVLQGGQGDGGNLLITAHTLDLANGSQLLANTNGIGNAGNITLQIRDQVSLSGVTPDGKFRSAIRSQVNEGGDGNGGNIVLSARALEMTDNTDLNVSTFGQGNAGNITIEVQDQISLDDSSYISSSVIQGGEGKGGNLFISAQTIALRNGGQLNAITQGKGDAGNIFLGTENKPVALLSISGTESNGRSSALFSFTDSLDSLGGNIRIFADRIHLSDGAVLDTRTYATGSSGTIKIDAKTIEIFGGAQILAISENRGSANTITLNVKDQLLISGIDPNYTSRSGQFLNRVAPISPESGIYTSSRASENAGNAGSIFITAPRIQLDDRAKIDAQSATIAGGNINIRASNRLVLRNGSQISASASQGGNGGNLDINTGFLIAVPKENSDIRADAFKGTGGKITIFTTGGIFGIEPRSEPTNLSDITASSGVGFSGTVTLATPDTDELQNNLGQLPQISIDTNVLLSNSCIVRNHRNGTFYITGTGGLPTTANDLSIYSTGTIQPVNPPSTGNQKAAIVEPQGVYPLANGQLVMSRECPSQVAAP